MIKALLCLSALILSVGLYNKLNKTILDITEQEKCPFCFGTDFCDILESDHNDLKLESNSIIDVFNNYFSVKNVFKTNKHIVIKKLASTSQLKSFDENLCHENGQSISNCDITLIENDFLTKSYDLMTNQQHDLLYSLNICHANVTEQILSFLLNKMSATISKNHYFKHLWTILKINPEPIILQILPSSDYWPVPKYFGSCGRAIFEQDCGQPLANYLHYDFISRIQIGLELINAVYNFTYKHNDFVIYLTDISFDNIAINLKLNVKFVDLENVVIAHRHEVSDELKIADTHYDDDENFIYYLSDLCSSSLKDHNFYALFWILQKYEFFNFSPTEFEPDTLILNKLIKNYVDRRSSSLLDDIGRIMDHLKQIQLRINRKTG